MQYTVIIPVLNAGPALLSLIDRLLAQTVPPEEIVVVDSASEDGIPARAAERGKVRLVSIRREDFDHGGTRDLALRSCSAPFIVMMTQDAMPVNDRCMESLLSPFADSSVAAVCGRQIAFPEAKPAEKAVRDFRYPAESDIWEKKDIPRKGITAFLLSDVCAAYRAEAYRAVGGFKHPIETNEDMLIAADFLDAGYKLAYRGDAAVFHSHDYTLRQEYERNRKIGAFMRKYGDRFGGGSVNGEGFRLVKFVAGKLLKEGRIGSVFSFGMNCGARLLGSRRGRRTGGDPA